MMLYSLFREKFIKEVKHYQWFQDFVPDKNLSYIDQYRKNGVFASGVGDIIVDACANILRIFIEVTSSSTTLCGPQLLQISSNPLYLAYNVDGSTNIIKPSLFSVQCRRTNKYHQIVSIQRTMQTNQQISSNPLYLAYNVDGLTNIKFSLFSVQKNTKNPDNIIIHIGRMMCQTKMKTPFMKNSNKSKI